MKRPEAQTDEPRSRALSIAAALSLFVVFLPAEWLVGSVVGVAGEVAERQASGALVWRAAFLALAAFLLLVRRFETSPEHAVEEEHASHSAQLVLLSITGVAALVRIPGLNLGLWFDELWMLVEFVRADFPKSPREFPADNHHPLYTILAWISVRAFGEEPWALRLPAWLFGVASVPALFVLGRRIAGERLTLVACGLLALSYHHVSFSQNARGYTALLFFTIVATHGFLEAERTGRRSAWLLQGLALGCATFAHTTGVFVALAQALAWLFKRRRAPLLGLIFGGLVSVALHALMLPQMLWFFVLREGTAAVDAEWKSPLWTLAATAESLGLAHPAGYAALGLAFSVGCIGCACLARRRVSAAAVFVLTPALGGIAMLLLGRNMWPRFFFFCAGFFVLFGAAGLDGILAMALRDTRRRTACLVALVLATAVFLPKAWFVPKQDYAAARDWVVEHRGPHDHGVTVGLASFPFEDYYGGGFEALGTVAELEARDREFETVYLVSTFGVYLETRHPEMYAWLKANSEEVARFRGSVGDGDIVVVRLTESPAK